MVFIVEKYFVFTAPADVERRPVILICFTEISFEFYCQQINMIY